MYKSLGSTLELGKKKKRKKGQKDKRVFLKPLQHIRAGLPALSWPKVSKAIKQVGIKATELQEK